MSLSTTSKRFLNTSWDGDSATSLGSLFQCLITLLENRFFLTSNLYRTQLEAILSSPVTSYILKEANPHLATTSFQGVVEMYEPPLSLLFSRFNSHSSREGSESKCLCWGKKNTCDTYFFFGTISLSRPFMPYLKEMRLEGNASFLILTEYSSS